MRTYAPDIHRPQIDDRTPIAVVPGSKDPRLGMALGVVVVRGHARGLVGAVAVMQHNPDGPNATLASWLPFVVSTKVPERMYQELGVEHDSDDYTVVRVRLGRRTIFNAAYEMAAQYANERLVSETRTLSRAAMAEAAEKYVREALDNTQVRSWLAAEHAQVAVRAARRALRTAGTLHMPRFGDAPA